MSIPSICTWHIELPRELDCTQVHMLGKSYRLAQLKSTGTVEVAVAAVRDQIRRKRRNRDTHTSGNAIRDAMESKHQEDTLSTEHHAVCLSRMAHSL